MKALFLCAGEGTRLRPITYAIPKALIPVGGKPVLFHGIEKVKRAGIDEIVVVVNPCTFKIFREIMGDGKELGVKVEYAIQEEPLGLAHAVKSAKDLIAGDDFLLYLGDNVIEEDIDEILSEFEGNDALILLDEVEDPRRFGVAVLKDGFVKRVVEKPKDPPSNLAIVGLYVFKSVVFDVIEDLKPSWRGEYEITDAIGSLIDRGYKVKGKIMKGWWRDVGTFKDLLETNSILLKDRSVSFGEGSDLKNVHIDGPVLGGKNVKITRARLGPNVYLGDNVIVEESTIVNSIVLDGAVIRYSKIKDSIVGANSIVESVESHSLIVPNDSILRKARGGF